MKTILHKAESRGHANHGWLNTYHTFSFANYYNPERMHFGALRVLNDDTVAGGMGFTKHPHRDMEIITIPLSGDLCHGDSMGNQGVISKGEIQVMSAGTGIMHSEMNANGNKEVKLLQIWVIPNQMSVTPRYDQIEIAGNAKPNDFQQIVSPNANDEGVWIHQEAWFNLANFTAGNTKEYRLHHKGNGVYVFVISGQAKVGNLTLDARDGVGITEVETFTLEAITDSEILLMEVPMIEVGF
ncbi:MAG: pirin family protein [Capnocytophaga sp.]|nr:pirin family protein [Capnocytophaga sp.]